MSSKSIALMLLFGVSRLIFGSHASFAQNSFFEENDFQTIKNYIFLESKKPLEIPGRPLRITLLDRETNIRFDYVSNAYGWSAIQITDLSETSIDYFLNHEVRQSSGLPIPPVIILTSSGGTKTEEKGWRHVYALISKIKRRLLSPENVSRLQQILLSYKEEKNGFIKDLHIVFSIQPVDHQLKIIEIEPSLNSAETQFISYRISERITSKRINIKWQYLNEKADHSSDAFFFKHFSGLLVSANQSGTASKVKIKN